MGLHRSRIAVLVGLMLGVPFAEGRGQEVMLPINIRVQKVTVETGSLYRFYLPDGEFHGRLEKAFKYVTTHAEADYDFLTGDIGFGIGQVFPKVPLKPGVFFRDHLLFRPLDAETGEWNRKQGMMVHVEKGLPGHLTVRAEFKNERQKSPSKERLMDIVSFVDRTIRIGLRWSDRNAWDGHLALEKGLEFVGGDFKYTLLSIGLRRSYETEWGFSYAFDAGIEGNITDKPSPRYYLGGRSTLIGYDNDEVWGKKRALLRNDLEFQAFKGEVLNVRHVICSHPSILGRVDVGNAGNAEDLESLGRYKVGVGLGLGVHVTVYDAGPMRVSAMVGCGLAVVGGRLVWAGDPKVYVGFGG